MLSTRVTKDFAPHFVSMEDVESKSFSDDLCIHFRKMRINDRCNCASRDKNVFEEGLLKAPTHQMARAMRSVGTLLTMSQHSMWLHARLS